MPSTPTTPSQVQAYRFVLRRMQHALVRKDAIMLHDPMRTQGRALGVGFVLAVLGLAGFALLSVFRPAADLGDATILLGKDTGALYVKRDGVVHPVLNLASARLVAGQAASPVSADESAIAELPRGALLGIPGAPSDLPGDGDRPDAGWTVCDSLQLDRSLPAPRQQADAAVSTTVVAGALGRGSGPVGSTQGLLVRGPDQRTYLLYEGKRAAVDLRNPTLVRALGLDQEPRRVSAGLLSAVPEVPELVAPRVPGAGIPSRFDLGGTPVGSVLAVGGGEGVRYYLVLTDGVEEVSLAAADVIAAADQQGRSNLRDVRPTALLADIPAVPEQSAVDLSSFPQQVPQLVASEQAPVVCLGWQPGTVQTQPSTPGGAAPEVPLNPVRTLFAGGSLPLPDGARSVGLAQADGNGQAVDAVYLPPGKAALVRSVGPSQPASAGELYLVGDTGVRFGIPDGATAGVLGLGSATTPAPQEIVGLLPQGPALDPTAALVAHDSVARDPAGVAVPAGR